MPSTTSIGSSAAPPGHSDASVTGQTGMRVSQFVPHFVVLQASLHVAVHVQACRRKASGIHSRTANKLPHLSRARHHCSCIRSWVSHPVKACGPISKRGLAEINDLRTSATSCAPSQADGWRRSTTCAHLRLSMRCSCCFQHSS